MVKQALCVLIAVALVANQLGVVPHAHTGLSMADRQEHNCHPHFHIGSGWHSHEHSTEPTADVSAPTVRVAGRSHDADAVYFPMGCQETAKSSPDGKNADFDGASVGAAANLVLVPELEIVQGRFHPPDVRPGAGTIYLTLRALRI